MALGTEVTAITPIERTGSGLTNYYEEIAMGNVPGKSSVNKFGEVNIDTKDETWVVWDGADDDIGGATGPYPYPTTATITDINQAADQAAMRGENIEVQGLDASWELSVETIALDASDTSTKVTLVTPLIRIFRMKVVANVVIDEDVRAMDTGAGTEIFALIQAGNNQTLMALYTIPAGKTGLLIDYWASMTVEDTKEPKGANIRLWMADRANSYEFQLKHSRGIQKGGQGFDHKFTPYMRVNEKTDIKLEAYVDDQPGKIGAGFDIILVDD